MLLHLNERLEHAWIIFQSDVQIMLDVHALSAFASAACVFAISLCACRLSRALRSTSLTMWLFWSCVLRKRHPQSELLQIWRDLCLKMASKAWSLPWGMQLLPDLCMVRRECTLYYADEHMSQHATCYPCTLLQPIYLQQDTFSHILYKNGLMTCWGQDLVWCLVKLDVEDAAPKLLHLGQSQLQAVQHLCRPINLWKSRL